MPRFDLTLPFNRLARIFASFSVRTRIVVLALIPVGGFLANGFTYTAGGESEVGRAFRTVTHSTAVSDASRDFKSAVASMRLIVKDFTASPDDTLIARFEQAHALALKGLDALAESIDHIHAETITSLRKDVLGLRENFNEHGREKPAKDLPWSRRK
jgi:methyl-accepting chemotaxis protein